MAPVNIFKHGADEEKAETARLVWFMCCFLLAFIAHIHLYVIKCKKVRHEHLH